MTSPGRQYPDGPLKPPPGVKPARLSPSRDLEQAFADFSGFFLQNLYAPAAEPGPPYVHTFVPPEPIGQDEDGNDIYPEPGPAYTLVKRPVADAVAEAGFGPVPPRIEITADFCQCPACREARYEP